MQEAKATIQKGISEGRQTCPSRRVQTQEEEGSEEVEGPAEVAARMCLRIFVACLMRCSINIFVTHLMRCSVNCITLLNKDVSKTRSLCFYADRLRSHIL